LAQIPRLIVHNLAQAEAALRAAAECGTPVILESPPDAARYLGAPYFRAMIEAARAAVPAAEWESVLDCGDAPGLALEAIRQGVRAVRLAAEADVFARVADIAAQSGVRIEIGPPPVGALDLGLDRDSGNAVRRFLAPATGSRTKAKRR